MGQKVKRYVQIVNKNFILFPFEKMESASQINFCKVCLKAVTVENLKRIDENVKEILAVLLLRRNYEEKDYLCGACFTKVFAAFDFKATCLYVENKIVPYINSEETRLDLRDIYLKEHLNRELIKMEEDQRICRLCFQLISDNFTSVDKIEVDTMNAFIPEVNFSFTKDPVVCQSCFDSLAIHSSFVENCVLSLGEDHTKNVRDDVTTNSEFSSDPRIKSEDIEIKFEREELMEMEDVDVKLEGSDEEMEVPR